MVKSTRKAAMEHEQVSENALFCHLQDWFRSLIGSSATDQHGMDGTTRIPSAAPESPMALATLGFKELMAVPAHSIDDDHKGHLPPARHLPVEVHNGTEMSAVDGAAETLPRWLTFLRTLFPCGRIIFTTRRDTKAQAAAAFHRKQGSTARELEELNRVIIHRFLPSLGDRAKHIAMEDISPETITHLAQWLGFNCTYDAIPHANDATVDGGSEYHADYESVHLRCGGSASVDASQPSTAPSEQMLESPTYGALSASALPSLLTLGIKHVSDFAERRESLRALVGSIRASYATLPLLIVYDGAYSYFEDDQPASVYDGSGRHGETILRRANERYLRLKGSVGLAAGRNAIVANSHTPYVMVCDDDVEFHHGTRLELLIAHLLHDPSLSLVAGCYYPATCYAHNLVIKERTVLTDQVSAVLTNMSAPIRAMLVQNFFIARVVDLAAHPWDNRQQVRAFLFPCSTAHLHVRATLYWLPRPASTMVAGDGTRDLFCIPCRRGAPCWLRPQRHCSPSRRNCRAEPAVLGYTAPRDTIPAVSVPQFPSHRCVGYAFPSTRLRRAHTHLA